MDRLLHVQLSSQRIDSTHFELDYATYSYTLEGTEYKISDGTDDFYSTGGKQQVEIGGRTFAMEVLEGEIALLRSVALCRCNPFRRHVFGALRLLVSGHQCLSLLCL